MRRFTVLLALLAPLMISAAQTAQDNTALTVSAATAPNITITSAGTGSVGVPYQFTISNAGGPVKTYAWTDDCSTFSYDDTTTDQPVGTSTGAESCRHTLTATGYTGSSAPFLDIVWSNDAVQPDWATDFEGAVGTCPQGASCTGVLPLNTTGAINLTQDACFTADQDEIRLPNIVNGVTTDEWWLTGAFNLDSASFTRTTVAGFVRRCTASPCAGGSTFNWLGLAGPSNASVAGGPAEPNEWCLGLSASPWYDCTTGDALPYNQDVSFALYADEDGLVKLWYATGAMSVDVDGAADLSAGPWTTNQDVAENSVFHEGSDMGDFCIDNLARWSVSPGTVNPATTPPPASLVNADAGNDLNSFGGAAVVAAGACQFGDQGAMTFDWNCTAGACGNLVITNETTATPTLDPTDADQTMTVTVTCDDGLHASDTDDMVLTVYVSGVGGTLTTFTDSVVAVDLPSGATLVCSEPLSDGTMTYRDPDYADPNQTHATATDCENAFVNSRWQFSDTPSGPASSEMQLITPTADWPANTHNKVYQLHDGAFSLARAAQWPAGTRRAVFSTYIFHDTDYCHRSELGCVGGDCGCAPGDPGCPAGNGIADKLAQLNAPGGLGNIGIQWGQNVGHFAADCVSNDWTIGGGKKLFWDHETRTDGHVLRFDYSASGTDVKSLNDITAGLRVIPVSTDHPLYGIKYCENTTSTCTSDVDCSGGNACLYGQTIKRLCGDEANPMTAMGLDTSRGSCKSRGGKRTFSSAVGIAYDTDAGQWALPRCCQFGEPGVQTTGAASGPAFDPECVSWPVAKYAALCAGNYTP